MPKNKVTDPITDQEMDFARLILAGGMTDRDAAEAVGLNPDSAAYTKSKPHVRAFMLEHRAATQQQLAQQEADERQRRNLDRERVLDRLWEIAYLSPEMTRGSVTAQVKAISMIIAMQNFIPDRRAVSSEKRFPLDPPTVQAPLQTLSSRPERSAVEGPAVPLNPQPTPAQAGPPPNPGPSQSTFAKPASPSEAPKPYVPLFGSVPDLGVDLPIKNPFVHPR
jgi:hypothetical protein